MSLLAGQPARQIPRGAQPGAPSERRRQKSPAREYAEALGMALLLALVIRTLCIQAYKIPSGSMQPTLQIGDHILVNKLIYGLRLPESLLGIPLPGLEGGKYLFHLESLHRGDIVVFVYPPDRTKDFIKRVVALAGDTVEIRDKAVYLNGAKVEDPHAHYQEGMEGQVRVTPRDNFGPLTVPEGKLFVMGDNRDRSYDSRFWGFVDRNDVEGKALIIYWSWDSESRALFPIRWERFGKLVE